MPFSTPYLPLTVYKASAGSGKTYTLAKRYIQMLVQRPDAYKHILAVTFTNKATEEMKMRILKELYALSHGHANAVMADIVSELGVSEEEVKQHTAEALSLLLHDYSNFNVQTIDSFFQKVLRNLAHEMGLNTMPRIELNDIGIEEQAVDMMFQSLTDNDERMEWITEFIRTKMDEEKGWNVTSEIKRFGKQLFTDDYKQHKHALNAVIHEPHFFDEYVKLLRQLKKEYATKIRAFGTTFLQQIAEAGLSVNDFSYGNNGVAGFSLKLSKENGYQDVKSYKRAQECAEDEDKWAVKKHPNRQFICSKAQQQWIPLLKDALQTLQEGVVIINTVDLTTKNMHQLRLLQNIDETVEALSKELNCFLLSNTQSLLHDMLYDEHGHSTDAPFIFEKIGTRLHHIMIDEFQDTGRLQWQNFRILLEECMAHRHSQNIIVGDVKQSIYRWRAGDWRLLQHIQQNLSTPKEDMKVQVLEHNWRSDENIILFNNTFFELAKDIEQQRLNTNLELTGNTDILDAYDKTAQRIPPSAHKGGFVSIQLFDKECYTERTLNQLTEHIVYLLHHGVAPRDIAILCRRNSDLATVAAHLSRHVPDVALVAREAFKLSTSLSVLTIIEAMRLLLQPHNTPTLAFLVTTYQQHILQQPYLETLLKADESQRRQMLPAAYTEKEKEMSSMPLYDLAEYLYNTFQLYRLEEESPYICAFFDMLQNYVNNNAADITAFLHAWDTRLKDEKVSTARHNGIQFLTIHTSKGLEFPYVFMPFTDWNDSQRKNEILWCEPTSEPFSALPAIPINLVSTLNTSLYQSEYKEEEMQRAIDRLNLLYVGFTRARKGLFVSGLYDSKESRSALIRSICSTINGQQEKYASILPGYRYEDRSDVDDKLITFQFGELNLPTSDNTAEEKPTRDTTPTLAADAPDDNPFEADIKERHIRIQPQQSDICFMQSNDSRHFVGGDESQQQQHYIERGKVLHYIFSRIRTLDDTETILHELEAEGVLGNEGLSYDDTKKMIMSALRHPEVAEWFSPHQQIINERTITTRDPQSGRIQHIRPDRVIADGNKVIVIDFKFGKEQPQHREQVQNYMWHLRQMGYTEVSGYLWYVYQNHVFPVELSSFHPTPHQPS